MENIISKIEQMAKCRNLPAVSDINIDTRIRNGKLDTVKISFYVGEMPVDVEWSDCIGLYDKDGYTLDAMALVAHELDGLFHVNDILYDSIAEAHLDNCGPFKKIINGVFLESHYDDYDTDIIAISQKPYYDFEDMRMCKTRDLTTDFCIYKYFEVRERVKERRVIADENEREHLEYLRRTTVTTYNNRWR